MVRLRGYFQQHAKGEAMKEEQRFIRTITGHSESGKQYRIHLWIPFFGNTAGRPYLLDDNKKIVNRDDKGIYRIADDDLGEIRVVSDDPDAP
jgi:hypothetical protein